MEVVEEKVIKRHSLRLMGHDDEPFLLEDILIHVLSKLPVKTLLRFRCVSKRWLYLISDDPHFIQLHSQQSKSKPPLLLLSSAPTHSRKDLSPYTMLLTSTDMETTDPISRFEIEVEDDYARLLPTRFGLVCIHDNQTVHICNPSIHKFITLPKPPFILLDSFVDFGFGYVQYTDEYKVVCLISPDFDIEENGISVDVALFPTKCLVFTLGMKKEDSTSSCSSSSATAASWAWRRVMNSPYHVDDMSPAFVNGAIHWVVLYLYMIDTEVYHGNMIDPHNTIIAFDVERVEFRLVPHPEGCHDLRSLEFQELQLVELRGLLCLSCTEGSKMDLWMLEGYENGNHMGTWMKEYSIDLNVLERNYLMGEFRYYSPRDRRHTGAN